MAHAADRLLFLGVGRPAPVMVWRPVPHNARPQQPSLMLQDALRLTRGTPRASFMVTVAILAVLRARCWLTVFLLGAPLTVGGAVVRALPLLRRGAAG
ncbi:hypothetical protein NDU88_008620 [Pleurodeles waltl]|uniref:Uncharacterized protein n=1 Tax=Pleurodeles waltl TaxID=8319 RepID=A0AAV7PPN9_PLEWA|nr:hypothetical protein NDU88_008620 [Pleurodeles waltl]